MKRSFRDDILPVILRASLLVIGGVGQWLTFTNENFMASTAVRYYTNQSNWFIMAITAVFLVFDVLKLRRGDAAPQPPNWLYAVKHVCTVGITLTFLVFSFMLMPQMISEGHGGYIFTAGNLCVHSLVPVLAIVDWCLWAWPYRTKRGSAALGIILPLCYVIYALVGSAFGMTFGEGSYVPYYFLDYRALGWLRIDPPSLGVVWWIIILSAVILLMSRLFIAIKDAVGKKRSLIANKP